jgi:hypothetical protein
MALSRQSADILWSAATTKVLNANSTRYDSDAKDFDSADVQAAISMNALNAGTPASGDYVDTWIKFSTDGTNFDTDEHATYLGRWNTFATDNPGENPAFKVVDIPCSAKAFKLSVLSHAAATTRNITLTARLHTQRAA